MLLYKDILSPDSELVSDAYKPKEIDGIVYEVDCKMINKGGENFDIGANPSAEEGEEALDDKVEKVNDVIDTFKLQPTSFDKKTYLEYLKKYMKAVKTKLQETDPDAVAAFEKGAQAYAKKIIADFKNYEFYVGEHVMPDGKDTDGMVALLNYREDGITPYFTFWKHGCKEEKC